MIAAITTSANERNSIIFKIKICQTKNQKKEKPQLLKLRFYLFSRDISQNKLFQV